MEGTRHNCTITTEIGGYTRSGYQIRQRGACGKRAIAKLTATKTSNVWYACRSCFQGYKPRIEAGHFTYELLPLEVSVTVTVGGPVLLPSGFAEKAKREFEEFKRGQS